MRLPVRMQGCGETVTMRAADPRAAGRIAVTGRVGEGCTGSGVAARAIPEIAMIGISIRSGNKGRRIVMRTPYNVRSGLFVSDRYGASRFASSAISRSQPA